MCVCAAAPNKKAAPLLAKHQQFCSIRVAASAQSLAAQTAAPPFADPANSRHHGFNISTTACISYFFVRGLILDNLKQIALLKLEKGTDEIDRWLSSRKAEIETIAYDPTVSTLNWKLVEPQLQREIYRLKEYFILSLTQPDGSLSTL